MKNTTVFEAQPTLHGDLISLRPLRQDDFEALYQVARDPLIWEQHPERNRYEPAIFRAFFDAAVQSGGALIVQDRQTGATIGSSRFFDWDLALSDVEIGWTFLARRYWGGRYNAQLKDLMLRHAFRFVDSVVFKVGAQNIRSQRAVLKLGATLQVGTASAGGYPGYAYRLTRSSYLAADSSNTTLNTAPNAALTPLLGGRTLAQCFAEFETRGFVIFERVLSKATVASLRSALTPYLEQGKLGRNDFEGHKTNRVYAMLAKSRSFADLACHPLALAFAEAELGSTCLLSACLAINLHPGETAQPWHYDDRSYQSPRPRRALGVSAFWAIDDTTELNGATEVIPGSHLWGAEEIAGAARPGSFMNAFAQPTEQDPGARSDVFKFAMPAGSLAIAKGTLWHRGGANRSDKPRMIITPQYCVGWARQLENMCLAVPPSIAATLPERAQELLGYSIHPPFLGYVDGMHPRRLLMRQKEPKRT